MSHNKYQGYYCLSWTSWILFLLSLGVVAVGVVIEQSSTVLPIEGIERYGVAIRVGGILLSVWSFLGICSVCGGCLIYFHAIASSIFSIIFLLLAGGAFYFGTSSNSYPSLKESLFSTIETIAAINGTETMFLSMQTMLDCCGYNEYQKTHPNCDNLQNCKLVIESKFSTICYVIGMVFGVYFLASFLLCIPGCVRMRSFHRFH